MCEMISESCLVMVVIRQLRSFTSVPYYYESHSSPRAGLTRRPGFLLSYCAHCNKTACLNDGEKRQEEAMAVHSMTRRTALGAASMGVSSLIATQAMAQENPRKTFVLVHGAYHGGWCWRRVADLLEVRGHKVYAPSLTGNGDRSHLLSKDINLDTQIADITNLA